MVSKTQQAPCKRRYEERHINPLEFRYGMVDCSAYALRVGIVAHEFLAGLLDVCCKKSHRQMIVPYRFSMDSLTKVFPVRESLEVNGAQVESKSFASAALKVSFISTSTRSINFVFFVISQYRTPSLLSGVLNKLL